MCDTTSKETNKPNDITRRTSTRNNAGKNLDKLLELERGTRATRNNKNLVNEHLYEKSPNSDEYENEDDDEYDSDDTVIDTEVNSTPNHNEHMVAHPIIMNLKMTLRLKRMLRVLRGLRKKGSLH